MLESFVIAVGFVIGGGIDRYQGDPRMPSPETMISDRFVRVRICSAMSTDVIVLSISMVESPY